ncbi:MAG TPA: hypothetical protein VFT31_10765 [Kribbella sp.]|nr:hypothetical protein [Kribbella sp.]
MTQKMRVARVITAVTTMGAAALLTAGPADARVPDEPDRNPVVQAEPAVRTAGLHTDQIALGALGGLTLAGAGAAGVAARRRFGQRLGQN